jgi:inner membrane protein
MVFFGHIGITTAIFNKYEKLIGNDKKLLIDYRFVIIGSILPDLIDKPMNILVDHTLSGRMYAHTLLFSAILLLIGMVHNFKYINVFILGLCCLVHIILLDGMWLDPKVFLFPLYGINLTGGNHYINIPYISAIYTSSAYLIIGEILGIFILYKYIKDIIYKNKIFF